MRSHRLHRFATLTVNRLLVIGLIGWVMVLGFSPSELGERPEPEVTIIKAAEVNPNPYQQEYEEMLYPTVRIETTDGIGSGVVIETTDKHGWTQILTAAHVVGNQSVVEVELYDSTVITASVVITDTVKDLALLHTRIKSPLKRGDKGVCYSARLAPKDYTPYIFTPVYTVGCSLGLPPRPSAGIISAINTDSWEVSSPILPGNSGGGVFTTNTHELIGIAVWVHTYNGQLVTTMAGIVPIQTVYEFLESVESKESDSINSMDSIDSLDCKERR